MRRLIDKIDLEILKFLSKDSKITFQDIAKKLDVSNTTIHVRVKRMQRRVFRPDLEQKPIVVLSNNDGCVIARSNEA